MDKFAVTGARNTKRSKMEAENQGVIEEVAHPEAEQITPEGADQETQITQDTSNTDLIEEESSKIESEKDRNWRAMREKVDQLQRETEKERAKREEYEQILYNNLVQSQKQAVPEEVDEFANIQSDEWLTKEQSQRLSEKLAEKKAKEIVAKALEEERKRRSDEELPNRLNSQFNDFNAVVTDENVKQLKELEPEVAQALSLIGDKYAQAVAAYKYIKKFVPGVEKVADYQKKVKENSSKPGTLSTQSSALSKAHNFERGLTPELKNQLYKEMVEASKRN